ncbi:MAG: bile acid:sodium symporter family protein [Negativicutes bacterium]|nr:bile acid:sodium symporter family protein [Negativicutes bacterium]
MLSLFDRWNVWLGQHMFLLVLSGLFFGFFAGSPNIPHAGLISIVLFAYSTFVTAMGTSFREFLSVLSRPWIPLWILVLIHLVTPLFAGIAGLIFYPDNYHMRLGYLIGASVPIGVTSILWTSITAGNVPISLVAVTLDTLIVPIILPAFFKIIVGQALAINYAEMVHQLLWMITAPSLAGMLLNDLTRGEITGFSRSFGGVTAKLSFALVIFLNAAVVAPDIHWSWPVLKIVAVCFLMVAGGYFLGYAGSLCVKGRPRAVTMAMIYCVGLRNISFGMVLALAYFPPAVAVPITLFMLFQQPLAAAIPHIIRRFGKEEEASKE